MSQKRGKILNNIEITKYAAAGKGMTYHQDKAIFVAKTVPGDVLDIKISRSRSHWMEGTPVTWHHYSDKRIKPVCVYFGDCGGCQWQMIPYAEQLKAKQQEIDDMLLHHAKFECSHIIPIQQADNDFYYRNKLEFTFSPHIFHTASTDTDVSLEKAVGTLGFHVPRRFDKVLHIHTCHLQDDKHNLIRNTVYKIACHQGLTFYDVRRHTGLMRNIQIRCNADNSQWLLWIIFGEQGQYAIKNKLLDTIQKALPFLNEIHFSDNVKFNDSTHDLNVEIFYGQGFITETLGDLVFQVDAKSFFQTHTAQAKKLYDIAIDFASLTPRDVVYDLYCGVGTIALCMARFVQKVVGVEIIEEAIRQAQINAAINQINNCSWFLGKVEELISPAFFAAQGKPDVIILDPPRAGLHPSLIAKIIGWRVPKLVYISCKPSTQFRDLGLLADFYKVEKMQAVDMFPQTHHLENVALLTAKP